jgi:hypothetical protein
MSPDSQGNKTWVAAWWVRAVSWSRSCGSTARAAVEHHFVDGVTARALDIDGRTSGIVPVGKGSEDRADVQAGPHPQARVPLGEDGLQLVEEPAHHRGQELGSKPSL